MFQLLSKPRRRKVIISKSCNKKKITSLANNTKTLLTVVVVRRVLHDARLRGRDPQWHPRGLQAKAE